MTNNTQRDPSTNTGTDRDQKGQQGNTQNKQQQQSSQSSQKNTRSDSDSLAQSGGAADHHGTVEGRSTES